MNRLSMKKGNLFSCMKINDLKFKNMPLIFSLNWNTIDKNFINLIKLYRRENSILSRGF